MLCLVKDVCIIERFILLLLMKAFSEIGGRKVRILLPKFYGKSIA
jgi:hypothetical protein